LMPRMRSIQPGFARGSHPSSREKRLKGTKGAVNALLLSSTSTKLIVIFQSGWERQYDYEFE
jgi:hypothetical protein